MAGFGLTDQQQMDAWMQSIQAESDRRKLNKGLQAGLYGQDATLPDQGFAKRADLAYGPQGTVMQEAIRQDVARQVPRPAPGQQVEGFNQGAMVGASSLTPSGGGIDPAELAKRGIRATRTPQGTWSFTGV